MDTNLCKDWCGGESFACDMALFDPVRNFSEKEIIYSAVFLNLIQNLLKILCSISNGVDKKIKLKYRYSKCHLTYFL